MKKLQTVSKKTDRLQLDYNQFRCLRVDELSSFTYTQASCQTGTSVYTVYDESFDLGLGASLHVQLTHQIENLALALPKFAFFYSNGGLQFLLRQL